MGMKISDLTGNGTIDPAQTLIEIEQLDLTAGTRSRKSLLTAAMAFLAGTGWTTQTIKGNSDRLDVLEGFGNTFVYASSAGAQSCANGTTSLIFGTEVDPGGNYNATTGEYTVPETGFYDVSAGCNMASAAWVINNSVRLGVYLNGSNTSMIGDLPIQASATFVARVRGSGVISCTAGQVLTIQLTHNQGGAVNTSGAGTTDYVRIIRVA